MRAFARFPVTIFTVQDLRRVPTPFVCVFLPQLTFYIRFILTLYVYLCICMGRGVPCTWIWVPEERGGGGQKTVSDAMALEVEAAVTIGTKTPVPCKNSACSKPLSCLCSPSHLCVIKIIPYMHSRDSSLPSCHLTSLTPTVTSSNWWCWNLEAVTRNYDTIKNKTVSMVPSRE